MTWYTSHIYAEAKPELLTRLKSDPNLLPGLFYIRELGMYDTRYITKERFPENGLIVIREVCDPQKNERENDEVLFHQRNNSPVVSWWSLSESSDIDVILPASIPTAAFGNIVYDDNANPPPPVEFLRYLKRLSIEADARIAFYHYYTAYEGRLATAEYAWLFGGEDSVLVRHMDGIDTITRFSTGKEPQVISIKNEHQPVLRLAMDYLGVTLRPETYFDPAGEIYFNYFDWHNYKIFPE